MLECGLYDGVSDMVLNGHIKGLDCMLFNSICASLGNFIVFCKSGDYVFGGFASKLIEG